MLEFSVRDEVGLRDKHDPLLRAFVKENTKRFETVKGSSSGVEGLWKALRRKLIEEVLRLGRPVSLLLDISTLPRYLTGALLALGLLKGLVSSVTIYYAEGVYDKQDGDLQSVFTGERWRFIPIRGLEGVYDPTKSRFYLVSAGFEGSKTLRYLATQEPDRVSVLFADPGFLADYPNKSRSNNSSLMEFFSIPEQQIASAHAGDAIAAWSELSLRQFERWDLENVSYLCCGTKPHSLALILRALCSRSAAVLYNIPDIHKVVNTVPTGHIWTYSLRDLTKLA